MCLPVFKLVDIFAHRFTGSNCAWSDIIFIQSFVQKHTRSITTIYWIIVETEGLAYSTTLKSFQIYYHCPFTFSRRFCRLHGAPIKAVWLAPWRPDTSPHPDARSFPVSCAQAVALACSPHMPTAAPTRHPWLRAHLSAELELPRRDGARERKVGEERRGQGEARRAAQGRCEVGGKDLR